MAYNNIKFVNEDGIGILTISRPKALNALNTETVTELNDCVGKSKLTNRSSCYHHW